jgi:A/G-specific adenine glycosylase
MRRQVFPRIMIQRESAHLSDLGRRRTKLRRALLRWYAERGRKLPWRKTQDPSRILVSEIMLQQTQVSRVIHKYREFLERFPTLRSLARARTSSVIRAWSGLGYNARALRLQKIAQLVAEKFDGRIPADPRLLLRLPGIGRYTANAVASFAFHKDVPVVDTNIRRVLTRIFSRSRSAGKRLSERSIWEIAESLLPQGSSRDWTFALMDLGAMICTARRPLCAACPVSSDCDSAFSVDGKQVVSRRARREPSHGGIPNRIYRGRIVEVLRSGNGRSHIGLRDLGRRIKTPFRKSEEEWLRAVVHGLEREGLVRIISDPPGEAQVSLP